MTMTKAQKDNLFVLVKSLSKSEKRQFKLYVGRLGVNEESKFLKLFNILDKIHVYNEDVILKKGIVKKQQLSNLKAHLYKQILISLRLNPSHQDIRIQIREQLDFATILYHKGLYKQSLKILDKAKTLAINHEEKNVAYEIVELEKIIESQYITRSLNNRADELSIQARDLSRQNVLASKLSNLSLQLYGQFLKTGYVKNEEETKKVTDYFNARLPKYDINDLGYREKLWLYKAHLWFSFLTQDFLACYKYASKWVDLFYGNKDVIALDPDKFNLHFIEGSFVEGLPLIDEVLERLQDYKNRIDEHHIMVFYYKIASEFKKLHKKLKEFENDPYQSRAFLYLDIISWLESKIENRPIGDIIRDKFKISST